MSAARRVKVQNLRLGDFLTYTGVGTGGVMGEVISMSQLASLPSGRMWDVGLERKDWRGVVTLSDDDLVTVERAG